MLTTRFSRWSKAASIVSVAMLIVFALSVRSSAEVKPGDFITRDNATKVKDLLSPGVYYKVERGMTMKIVPTERIDWPPPYKDATEKYSGQVRLIGADASHAWLSVYCPGYGWVDVDPTNNMLPTDRHITVAYGRDYGDVSPIKGVFLGGGEHTMDVAVDVAMAGTLPA